MDFSTTFPTAIPRGLFLTRFGRGRLRWGYNFSRTSLPWWMIGEPSPIARWRIRRKPRP